MTTNAECAYESALSYAERIAAELAAHGSERTEFSHQLTLHGLMAVHDYLTARDVEEEPVAYADAHIGDLATWFVADLEADDVRAILTKHDMAELGLGLLS